MRLELRHLQMVCAIADCGSLNKAASALGLAPSALTAQLQRVERSLGGALFERDHRGARPTPLGDLVLDRARTLLPAVQDLHDEAARLTGGTPGAGLCRLGSPSSPLLAGLIRRLSTGVPAVQVTVQPSSSPVQLATMLSEGRIDYAVVGLCGDAAPPVAEGSSELAWRQIALDAVFVLVPADHHFAGRSEVELADFADVTWAASGPYDCCFDACFATACARAGFAMRRMYELDARTAVELTEAGQVVTLCQSSFRPPPGLVALPLAGAPLQWRHLLGWRTHEIDGAVPDRLVGFAINAYLDVISRIPRTTHWLASNPGFGAASPPGPLDIQPGRIA